MRHLLLPILLLFPVFTFGQEVDWPDAVEQGDLLQLQAPEADSCDWAILPNATEFLLFDKVMEGEQPTIHHNAVLIVSTKFEGDLIISLAISNEGVASTVLHVITVGEIVDPPPPDPDPPPPPGKIFAVMVEETDDRDQYTPQQIQALIAESDKEYMNGKGYEYRKVDDDVVEPDGQGGDRVPLDVASFLQRAEGQQLPRLIIAGENGKPLHDDVVVDEASVLKILKQYGGE